MPDASELLARIYGGGEEPMDPREAFGLTPLEGKYTNRPWYTPPLPPSKPQAELRDHEFRKPRDQFGDTVGQVVGPTAYVKGAHDFGEGLGDLYGKYREGDYPTAAEGTALTMLGMLPIPGVRHGKKRPSLDEYIEKVKETREAPRGRNSTLLDYDTMLEPQNIINNMGGKGFASQEPAFKNPKKVPQQAKNLSHPTRISKMTQLADDGMFLGPEGNMVNPWYYMNPLEKYFVSELGYDLGHERLSKFLGYNAATSMQTSVPRNILESMMVYYNDMNDIPINRLPTSDLTGAAYKNKVDISGKVAMGEGISGKTAHKIRNYGLNLHNVGVGEPDYVMTPTGHERVLTPVALDSHMADIMSLRKQRSGEPSERFVGPTYREGMKAVHKAADPLGAAGSDAQAGMWQSHLWDKYHDPVYLDPYAGIFENVIYRIARETGDDPSRVLSEFVHGRYKVPRFFTSDSIYPGIMVDQHYPPRKAGKP